MKGYPMSTILVEEGLLYTFPLIQYFFWLHLHHLKDEGS